MVLQLPANYVLLIFTQQYLPMRRNIYKAMILVAMIAPFASCHTEKKKAKKQAEQKVIRPKPRARNY